MSEVVADKDKEIIKIKCEHEVFGAWIFHKDILPFVIDAILSILIGELKGNITNLTPGIISAATVHFHDHFKKPENCDLPYAIFLIVYFYTIESTTIGSFLTLDQCVELGIPNPEINMFKPLQPYRSYNMNARESRGMTFLANYRHIKKYQGLLLLSLRIMPILRQQTVFRGLVFSSKDEFDQIMGEFRKSLEGDEESRILHRGVLGGSFVTSCSLNRDVAIDFMRTGGRYQCFIEFSRIDVVNISGLSQYERECEVVPDPCGEFKCIGITSKSDEESEVIISAPRMDGESITAAMSGEGITAEMSGESITAAMSGESITAAMSGESITAAMSASLPSRADPFDFQYLLFRSFTKEYQEQIRHLIGKEILAPTNSKNIVDRDTVKFTSSNGPCKDDNMRAQAWLIGMETGRELINYDTNFYRVIIIPTNSRTGGFFAKYQFYMLRHIMRFAISLGKVENDKSEDLIFTFKVQNKDGSWEELADSRNIHFDSTISIKVPHMVGLRDLMPIDPIQVEKDIRGIMVSCSQPFAIIATNIW